MRKLLTVFKQTFFQVLGKVVTSLVTFLILSMVARSYGKEDLGVFTLSLTYLGIFMLIADFGFNGHLLRVIHEEGAETEGKEETTFRKLLGARISWALILIVGSIALLPLLYFSGEKFIQLSIVGSLSIIGAAFFVTANLIFQKKLKYIFSVLATVIGTTVYFLLVMIFSNYGYPLLSLAVASTIGWLTIGVLALFFARIYLKNILPIFDFKFSLELIKKSWPIAATLSLNVIYFRADSFLIAYFKNLADVGMYNLAYQFFQASLVLPTFIMNAYYPILLKTYSGFKTAILIMFGISILGMALTFFLSPFLINLLAGEGYEGSVVSLRILSLGFPSFFISALFMWTMVAEGKYLTLLKLYTSALVLNLILNLLFIPKYSFLAASVTTVVSEYFILLLQSIFLRKVIFK